MVCCLQKSKNKGSVIPRTGVTLSGYNMLSVKGNQVNPLPRVSMVVPETSPSLPIDTDRPNLRPRVTALGVVPETSPSLPIDTDRLHLRPRMASVIPPTMPSIPVGVEDPLPSRGQRKSNDVIVRAKSAVGSPSWMQGVQKVNY